MRSLAWIFGCVVVVVVPGLVGAQESQLSDVLELHGVMHLQERGEHLIAVPRLVPDPRGGWLYWDEQSNDVRVYGVDGELRAAFGREGDGPGEFRGVMGLARLPRGRLVAVDRRGRISVWTAEGDSLLDDFDSGVARVQGLRVAAPGEVILQAAPVTTDPDRLSVPVLHRVQLDSRRTTASYFSPPLTKSTFPVATSVWSPAPWVSGDTAFVALSAFDSIWVVPMAESDPPFALPLRSSAIGANPSPEGVATGRVPFREWTMQSTFPGRFVRLADGGWLFQTWGLRREGPVRGLLRLCVDGQILWEAQPTPDLLGVDPASGTILIWDAAGPDPSSVRVMKESSHLVCPSA